MEVLHTKGLKKYYGNQENEVKALDGIILPFYRLFYVCRYWFWQLA